MQHLALFSLLWWEGRTMFLSLSRLLFGEKEVLGKTWMLHNVCFHWGLLKRGNSSALCPARTHPTKLQHQCLQNQQHINYCYTPVLWAEKVFKAGAERKAWRQYSPATVVKLLKCYSPDWCLTSFVSQEPRCQYKKTVLKLPPSQSPPWEMNIAFDVLPCTVFRSVLQSARQTQRSGRLGLAHQGHNGAGGGILDLSYSWGTTSMWLLHRDQLLAPNAISPTNHAHTCDQWVDVCVCVSTYPYIHTCSRTGHKVFSACLVKSSLKSDLGPECSDCNSLH